MHKLIATVFKILGMSLILMFLLDMTLLLVDGLNVNSKVVSIASLMQNEVARNNCMPNALVGMFEDQLDELIDNSNIATGVKTNMTSNLNTKGVTYQSISQDNVGEYGDIVPLVIEVTLSPWRFIMGKSALSMSRKATADTTLTYVYYVPCLRYLK